MFQHVVVVHYGHTLDGKKLSDKGRSQIADLRDYLVTNIDRDLNWVIFYPKGERYVTTADILTRRTRGVNHIFVEELWSNSDRPNGINPNISTVFEEIKSKKQDVSILITDFDMSKRYPKYHTERITEGNSVIEFKELNFGEAYWLNLHEGTWKHFPSRRTLYQRKTSFVKT